MVVEFSYRQPKHERRIIRIMTLVVILILGFSCLHSFGMWSPTNALSLDYEFEDTQIIWTWNDGEPPYNIWDSNGLIAEGYP